jgi:hypothetical protein
MAAALSVMLGFGAKEETLSAKCIMCCWCMTLTLEEKPCDWYPEMEGRVWLASNRCLSISGWMGGWMDGF